jgi:16S rRNA (cytosine967-C5)-methyltransferase
VIDPARRAAYDLLHEVAVSDAYANLVWPGLLAGVPVRDRGFATELAYGTLRMRGLHTAVLAAVIDRPLDRVDARLLDVCRLGAHQILLMRTPPHAALAQTVDLARDVCGGSAAGFANAVLRRITTADAAGWVDRLTAGMADVDRWSIEHSHPAWIIRAFQQALAVDDAVGRLEAVLVADNTPARPTLVARSMDPAELRALPGVEPGRWSPYAAHLRGGAPHDLPQVASGAVGVQDEGSQLVALALADAPLDGPDESWLDLAAGPGGKAALLAHRAAARGAALVAVEQHAHRADLVRTAVRGTPTHVITADATARPWGTRQFDRVLVDAPCTGLGALRRRPEARWRRQPSDLAALRPLQAALLTAALEATRPGGLVMYSTCSPHVAETDLIVADVVSRVAADMVDVRPQLPPDVGPGPAARLWPDLHGTDGMYLALLRKR